jgi:excinuclease ABC subunit A
MSGAPAITLEGVRVHNLQGIDVRIPLGKLTAVTGLSGAGKSSLVFDTLFAEAQRRYLQAFSPYIRRFLERFDRPQAEFIGDLPLAIAVQRPSRSRRATVGTLTEILEYLGLVLARWGIVTCRQCGQVVKAHGPADVLAALAKLPPGTRVSIAYPVFPEQDWSFETWSAGLREDGFVRVQIDGQVIKLGEDAYPEHQRPTKIFVLVDRLEAGPATPRGNDSIETAFNRGQGRCALLIGATEHLFDRRLVCPSCNILYPEPQARLFHFTDPMGACPHCHGHGIDPKKGGVCPSCRGARFNDAALSVRLEGQTIADLCRFGLKDLAAFFQHFATEKAPEDRTLMGQIAKRLGFMLRLELGYLTLDRSAATLSAGEERRVRLTAALGSNLVEAMYLVDEPTAGLHPRDTNKMLAELRKLQDAGNTVVLIEHDRAMIQGADFVVDLGPGAGEEGGQVMFQGPAAQLVDCAESITAAFVAGRDKIEVPTRRRPLTSSRLRLRGATAHNLQNLDVDFPLDVLCAVTGVSGAGKSSLVEDTLYPALCAKKGKGGDNLDPGVVLEGAGQVDEVVLMDQEPLAHSARSNPATYLKIFDDIREVFADTSEARIRNFGPGAFSFNQPGGRCEVCQGQGVMEVDMQFLADVTMPCPECHGERFKKELLAVKVRSLSIAEVLNLTVRQAFRFFRAQRSIEKRLKFLIDVGLDYLRLGQPITTLSGGECQRLKLASKLATSRKPRGLFILLEPATGLHPADVEQLLVCLNRLLESGHSLLVVEHHLDIIKCADHIVDLGPGAGAEGGRVVATGTPEEVAKVDVSHTGQWLRKLLP